MKRVFVLFCIICFAVFSVFVIAQNDMELVAARKKIPELVSYANVRGGLPSPCNHGDVGDDHTTLFYFPEGRADEVYVWDYNGYSYFKIDGDKATLVWKGFAFSLEGPPANQNNSFIKIISKYDYFNGKPVSFNSQCGQLPDFSGELEVFGVSVTTAYNGVYNAEGEILCKNVLSDSIRPGDPVEQYYYGVARCDSTPK
jgi:hypothetical protein